MKIFWVCVNGNIGRLLDEEDCTIARSRKAAINFCEENGGEWGFLDVMADEKTPAPEIKRMALREIW